MLKHLSVTVELTASNATLAACKAAPVFAANDTLADATLMNVTSCPSTPIGTTKLPSIKYVPLSKLDGAKLDVALVAVPTTPDLIIEPPRLIELEKVAAV